MEARIFQTHNVNVTGTAFYKILFGVFYFLHYPLKNLTDNNKSLNLTF